MLNLSKKGVHTVGNYLGKIYDVISSKKGYEGRLKFVSATGVSKQKALALKDTPKLIAKFERAASKFLDEDISKYL